MTAPGLPAELLSRIEDAGLNASAPPQQRWVDGWLVRFSPGKAQRARCINAVSAGRRPLDDKLAACATLYQQAGLPLLFRLTPCTQPPELDGQLAERGFEAIEDTRVMVCASLPGAPGAALPAGIHAEPVDSQAYAHIVGEQRGTSAEGREAHAERLRHSPVPYRALVLRSADGQVVAGGQVAVEGDLAGLYDVFTVPASLAGIPGASVPAGLSADGLPLGLQVLTRRWDEETLFRVCQVLEDAAQFPLLPAV